MQDKVQYTYSVVRNKTIIGLKCEHLYITLENDTVRNKTIIGLKLGIVNAF